MLALLCRAGNGTAPHLGEPFPECSAESYGEVGSEAVNAICCLPLNDTVGEIDGFSWAHRR